ncbi:MAG: peptidoglycan-associated lipoprotein Pal [Rickettsiales bacterium]
MNFFVKAVLAVFSLLLVAACDTDPSGYGSADGSGGVSGSATPGSQSDLEQNVGDRVFFNLDSSQLTEEAQSTLGRQAAWLKQYPHLNLTIEGHCDERGTREYNIALGERRANSAKKYLMNLGISSNRLATISYGKERPAIIGSDESAWSQNRRAVSVATNQ